jgi:drug/metabolite transporter (DMT)-like permease
VLFDETLSLLWWVGAAMVLLGVTLVRLEASNDEVERLATRKER